MIETLRHAPLFVLKLNVGYDRAVHVGDPRAGGRSVFPVDGGSFEGARMRGLVDPGGADWVTWRGDGAMLIDVRLTLTTHDGAAIGMTYQGLAHGEPAAMARFRSRELLAFQDIHVRTAIRFETGDPRYADLNTLIAIGQGMRTAEGPVYHVFAIR
ncbi:MAG: DUF3237 domain-containing protein [Pseudomonadota bacterium]